jgi:hypothetical protein
MEQATIKKSEWQCAKGHDLCSTCGHCEKCTGHGPPCKGARDNRSTTFRFHHWRPLIIVALVLLGVFLFGRFFFNVGFIHGTSMAHMRFERFYAGLVESVQSTMEGEVPITREGEHV